MKVPRSDAPAGNREVATIQCRPHGSVTASWWKSATMVAASTRTGVRRKARERVAPADELAALSDEQAVDLVFSAGFSTAAEVSDISGRGVGMDVVRTAIEQHRWQGVAVERVGAGTTMRLDLPMNIAMSRIMVVEAGGQVFGIPMDAVTETVRLTPERISQIKNNEGFVLRDRIVPICSLAELMNLPKKPAAERPPGSWW